MPYEPELRRLARRLGQRLLARRRRVVTAESCTGGWIAKAITDIPGSSQWFDTAFVAYSNAAKIRELGVREATLRSSWGRERGSGARDGAGCTARK